MQRKNHTALYEEVGEAALGLGGYGDDKVASSGARGWCRREAGISLGGYLRDISA